MYVCIYILTSIIGVITTPRHIDIAIPNTNLTPNLFFVPVHRKKRINAVTGELSFVGGDYENPQDADQNNTYEVTLRASDPSGQYGDQLVRISVTDANDSPTNTGPIALNNTNFQTAVNLWFTNEANATATYGPIKDWNTSAVTNMQNAFFNRATFD